MLSVGGPPVAVTPPALSREGDRAAMHETTRSVPTRPKPVERDAAGPDGLTDAERVQRDKLAARDREVRTHEQAHQLVGGRYAGAASYSYEMGPDDRRYAVAGEVPIDVAPVPGDPEETIAKMQVVAAAALAPAKPSAQDRAVAALARSQQLQAQAELFAQRREEAGVAAEGVSVLR